MSTIKEGMGLGMFQFPFGSKLALGHNGGIDGFQSNVAYFQKEKTSIALVGNGFACPMNDILIGVLTIVFGGDAKMPSFEKAEVADTVLRQYEGEYGAGSTVDEDTKLDVRLAFAHAAVAYGVPSKIGEFIGRPINILVKPKLPSP